MKRLIAGLIDDIDKYKFVAYLQSLTGINDLFELSKYFKLNRTFFYNLLYGSTPTRIHKNILAKIWSKLPNFSIQQYYEFIQNNPNLPSLDNSPNSKINLNEEYDINDINPRMLITYLRKLTGVYSLKDLSIELGFSSAYLYGMLNDNVNINLNRNFIDRLKYNYPAFSISEFLEYSKSYPNIPTKQEVLNEFENPIDLRA